MIRSYFECLLRALRENRMADAEELFSHLGESNEICLGFSRTKPQGKGMGPSDASKIFKSLKESPALRTGIMEDIEDFRIFVDNVDKDKMSDMTANIIKKQLIEYTQSKCAVWGIALTPSVPSGFYWDCSSNSWENCYTEMLVANGRKILLVPKRLVSFSSEYTPQKYMQHFVLNFLQNEQLRLNGPLVLRRKDKKRTPYVTKKSIREHNHLEDTVDKKWLADFTEKHPDVFGDFREQTRSKISAVSNEEISAEPIQTICSFLADHLNSIPMGSDSATVYHRTIVGIGNVKKCAVGKYPKSEKHGNTAQFSEVERSGTQENCGGIGSGCRLRLRPLPVLRRRQSQRVARIDPNAVVVDKNIAENDRFDLFSR